MPASASSSADRAFLGDTTPSGEYDYRVAFGFQPYALSLGYDSSATVFRGRGSGSTTLFEVSVETGPPGLLEPPRMLRITAQTNSGPVTQVASLPPQDGQYVPDLRFELEWVPSAFAAQAEGFLRVWFRYEQLPGMELALLASLENLDTYGMTVESSLLGVVDASGIVSGDQTFWEFRSRREDFVISAPGGDASCP